MKKEKIEELYGEHVTELTDAYDRYGDVYEYWSMRFEDFTQAINQAELELYERLDYNMECISLVSDIKEPFEIYHKEIKERIKELENEN